MSKAKSSMSIRWRLFAILVPPIILLLIAGGVLNYRASVAPGRIAYDQSLADNAYAIAAKLESAKGDASGKLRYEPIELLRANGDDTIYYSVRDSAGKLLAGDPSLRNVDAIESNPFYSNGSIDGRDVRRVTFHTRADNVPITINVAETINKRVQAERLIIATMVVVDFIQLDVTILLIWFAIYFGMLPLRKLGSAIDARSTRELEPLNQNLVPMEVRSLTSALNKQFAVLAESDRVQRQFVADSAHQLRTPITAMIGQIELLRQEPGAAAFEQYLSGLSASAKHVAHAVNQLLTLSRTDPSLLQVREFVVIDLDALVQQVVGSFIDRSLEFGLDLGAEVQLAKVRGNARLLGDLLSNLVDNALNYTPRGGRITVRTGLIDAAPYLEVEDNGPGIPESERSMVKRRFYRSPGSPGTGSGLGLAIVEDIARLHDAVVSIEAGQGDCGTRIRVLFVAPTQP